MSNKWHSHFIKLAGVISEKSEDRSTKVSWIATGPGHEILSTGYNGFPRGVIDLEERHDRPAKYFYTEHAERNTVYNAARIGVSLLGSTAYCNFEPVACHDCARAFIQAGVKTCIGSVIPFPSKGKDWTDSIEYGNEMFGEAGVNQLVFDGEKLIHYDNWKEKLLF